MEIEWQPKCRLLSFALLFWPYTFCFSAHCEVGMSEFQKGHHWTKCYVFLRARDRSNIRVISSYDGLVVFGGLHRTLDGLRMKILCHFCVQKGLKYLYPGGIFNLVSWWYGLKVKEYSARIWSNTILKCDLSVLEFYSHRIQSAHLESKSGRNEEYWLHDTIQT